MVSMMATNTSTSNQSFTSKRSTMVSITFVRQFMRLELVNNFSVSRVANSADSSKAMIFIP
jgi:acyl-CoA thioesterase